MATIREQSDWLVQTALAALRSKKPDDLNAWRRCEFVVVAIPKGSTDWEPVHPGHMDLFDAQLLQMHAARVGIKVEVWTLERWDEYDDALRGGMEE